MKIEFTRDDERYYYTYDELRDWYEKSLQRVNNSQLSESDKDYACELLEDEYNKFIDYLDGKKEYEEWFILGR